VQKFSKAGNRKKIKAEKPELTYLMGFSDE
jgi:hypothetical protein